MSSPNNADSSAGKGKTGSTPKKSSSGRDPGRKKKTRNIVTPDDFDAKCYNMSSYLEQKKGNLASLRNGAATKQSVWSCVNRVV